MRGLAKYGQRRASRTCICRRTSFCSAMPGFPFVSIAHPVSLCALPHLRKGSFRRAQRCDVVERTCETKTRLQGPAS